MRKSITWKVAVVLLVGFWLVSSQAYGEITDDRSTATDTTAVSSISLLKQISYMEQNPTSRAVMLYGYDGSEWKKGQVDSSGNLKVTAVALSSATSSIEAKQATGSNLHTVVDSGAVTATLANSAKVDCNGSAVAATLASETTKVIGTVNLSIDAVSDKYVTVAYSASQTAATVLTPTSGKKVIIVDIVISASAAGTVYLFDNTDGAAAKLTPILNLAANSGYASSSIKAIPTGAINNVVKYTSGSGVAGSIWIHYYEI